MELFAISIRTDASEDELRALRIEGKTLEFLCVSKVDRPPFPFANESPRCPWCEEYDLPDEKNIDVIS